MISNKINFAALILFASGVEACLDTKHFKVFTDKKCSQTYYIKWGLTLDQCALRAETQQECKNEMGESHFVYGAEAKSCECCTSSTYKADGHNTYKYTTQGQSPNSYTIVFAGKKCSQTHYIEWGLTRDECALRADHQQECQNEMGESHFVYGAEAKSCECCIANTYKANGYDTYKFSTQGSTPPTTPTKPTTPTEPTKPTTPTKPVVMLCNGRPCGTIPTTPTKPTTPSKPSTDTGDLKVVAKGKATTTRYWDCSGGACGCAHDRFGTSSNPTHCPTNAMFSAPAGNIYGATFYGTAAVSNTLGGGNWMAKACNKCWRVTGTANIPGSPNTKTILVLKGANYCPPANSQCNGKDHFDIAAPGFDWAGASLSNSCSSTEPNEKALHNPQTCGNWMIKSQSPSENCDCDQILDETLKNGCKHFKSLMWDNPTIDYEELDKCPTELDTPCWKENGNKYPFNPPPQKCLVRKITGKTEPWTPFQPNLFI